MENVIFHYSRKEVYRFRWEEIPGNRMQVERAGGGYIFYIQGNGKTQNPNYCDKQYIVYISPGDPRKKIRVNTYYLPQEEKVRICTHYDRGLCDTLEEYEKLPIEYIEEQAYGSWMDGAR